MTRLSRDLIIDEALSLIDERGLKALTARLLAARLGVRPGSLYHYFADMTDLLAEVAWSVVKPVAEASVEGETWIEHATAHSRVFRAALLQHPNVIPVLAGPLGHHVLTHRLWEGIAEQMEAFIGLLSAGGIGADQALGVIEAMSAYTIGAATVGSAPPPGPEQAPPMLGPQFTAALARGSASAEERFEFGLRSLLAGIAAEASRMDRTPVRTGSRRK